MNCRYCGSQLPEDDEFCHKGGRRQFGENESVATAYETCEIEPKNVGGSLFFGRHRFVATAIGPAGVYQIVESPIVSDGTSDEKLESIVADMVRQLTEAGWEPTGRGHDKGIYNYTFRRAIR